MNRPQEIDSSLLDMIADYMEKGFLENIIDMFRYDSRLYGFVGTLIQDERVRVRIGVTALMEELSVADALNALSAAPGLLNLLDHGNPVVRGDVSNILGMIGDKSVLSSLENALNDENPNVRLIAEEAIEDIKRRS
jgi:hypothetical protein